MKSILNEENLRQSIEKIHIYQNDENNQLSNIKNIMDGIGYFYLSQNTRKIDEINLNMSKKITTIKNIHYNNIYVLKHNIFKYQNIKIQVESKFNNIVG